MLGALRGDSRLELFFADALTPEWVALAQKSAALVVATMEDPVAALAYVATAGIATPIVVAMAARFREDIGALRKAGAFACLTMPVREPDVEQLVKSLMKRSVWGGIARVDGTLRLLLDPIGLEARYQEQNVRLSQREFAVLHYLSSRGGRPVAADELLTYVWGPSASQEKSRQILDVYIFQVRKKLETLGLKGAIATVRGFGYALVDAASPARSTER